MKLREEKFKAKSKSKSKSSEQHNENNQFKNIRDGKKKLIELASDPDVTDKEIISMSKTIKKNYILYIKSLKLNDSMSEKRLDELKKLFLENYKDIKAYDAINEIMEMIASEYEDLIKDDKNAGNTELKDNMEKNRFEILVKVLGNYGTHPENYSTEYLEKIIRNKIVKGENTLLINDKEVLEIINAKIKNNGYSSIDGEETKEFVNKTLINIIDGLIKSGTTKKLVNPKILNVLNSYAHMYSAEGDFKNYEKYLRLGLKLQKFENSQEYNELKNAYNGRYKLEENYKAKQAHLTSKKDKLFKINDDGQEEELLEIKIGDILKKDDTEEAVDEFIDQLKVYPGFRTVFESNIPLPQRGIGNGGIRNHSILSNREKLKNILLTIKQLNKRAGYGDATIERCYVTKDCFNETDGAETVEDKANSFGKYIIFPIENLETELMALEEFDDKEGSIFVINKKYLTPVISNKRLAVKKYRNPAVLEEVQHKVPYIQSFVDAIVEVNENRKIRPYNPKYGEKTEQDFINYMAQMMGQKRSDEKAAQEEAAQESDKNKDKKEHKKVISPKTVSGTASKNQTPSGGTKIDELVGVIKKMDRNQLKQSINEMKKELEKNQENVEKSDKEIIQKSAELLILQLTLLMKQKEQLTLDNKERTDLDAQIKAVRKQLEGYGFID